MRGVAHCDKCEFSFIFEGDEDGTECPICGEWCEAADVGNDDSDEPMD